MFRDRIHFEGFRNLIRQEKCEGIEYYDILDFDLYRSYNLGYVHKRLLFLININNALKREKLRYRITYITRAGFVGVTKKTKKKCKIEFTSNFEVILKTYKKGKIYKIYKLNNIDYNKVCKDLGILAPTTITTNYIHTL